MNISQIRCLIKVYELNSFTEAAKALYVSQPRLSQTIQNLEEELGFEIFERNRKGIKGVTTKGFEFIRQSIKTMDEFNQLEKWVPSSNHTLHLSSTLITHSQDAFIRLFEENMSTDDMNLDFWITSCYESALRVKNVESDMGIITILGPQYEEWQAYFLLQGIEYHNLKKDRFYVSVSNQSPLAQKYKSMDQSDKEISIDELSEALFITEKSFRMNDLTYEVYAFINSICPENRATVANTDIMYQLVQTAASRNAFVLDAIRPSNKTLKKYNLITIPLNIKYEIFLGYIQRKGESLSALSRRYLQLLKEELEIEEEMG